MISKKTKNALKINFQGVFCFTGMRKIKEDYPHHAGHYLSIFLDGDTHYNYNLNSIFKIRHVLYQMQNQRDSEANTMKKFSLGTDDFKELRDSNTVSLKY